ILAMSQQQCDEGRWLVSLLNQAKADRNTALNNLAEAQQIYDNNKAESLYALGYGPEEVVDIVYKEDWGDLVEAYQTLPERDTFNSISYLRLVQNSALLDVQVQTERSSFLPSLTLNAYYGANYYDNSFDLFKSGNWNGNSFVTVALRLPISEGFERQRKISRLRLQQEADQMRFRDERNRNRLEYLSALR